MTKARQLFGLCRPDRLSGQAIVFILMALAVLAVVFLWNVDVHMLVSGKTRAQNAGDAAAIAAARWQANTLNLVGELNLMHAAALDAGDAATIDATTNMQARLLFTGPLTGLAAAQTAAKKNGAESRAAFTKLLKEHAAEVLKYATPVGGEILFPEPYPGAWQEYHDNLIKVANLGIAAAPDNAAFFGDADGGHILLEKAFYEAVAGRDWCWFYLNAATGGKGSTRTILDDFTGYAYFAPLPEPSPPLFENCEIFGVGVGVRHCRLGQVGGLEEYLAATSFGSGGENGTPLSSNAFAVADNWYFFNSSFWENNWPGMTYGEEDFLPLAGSVREEYDYTGADAVTRLYMDVKMLSSPEPAEDDEEDEDDENTKAILWTAAAKPFGFLPPSGDGENMRPNAFGLVLPAFRDVRLIPIDAASSGGDGSFDIDWREHTDEHLPLYVESGALQDGCKYCRLIKKFEDPEFRKKGSAWLVENHHLCTLPPSGGGSHGGGTRRGH